MTSTPEYPPLPVAPFTQGDRVTLTIHDLAFGGEGVGRVGEFVVFVPYACPGDVLEVKITEIHKRFARAVIIRIQTRAPERVEPRC
jgi:23S rRNA (uracil1939-C5)-methyltransferase